MSENQEAIDARKAEHASRMEEATKLLRGHGFYVTPIANRYDRKDMVQRVMDMNAGPLKFAAYRVRDPETGEWSKIQFHLLYDNHIMGMLSEESAKLFCTMVKRTLEGRGGATEEERHG